MGVEIKEVSVGVSDLYLRTFWKEAFIALLLVLYLTIEIFEFCRHFEYFSNYTGSTGSWYNASYSWCIHTYLDSAYNELCFQVTLYDIVFLTSLCCAVKEEHDFYWRIAAVVRVLLLRCNLLGYAHRHQKTFFQLHNNFVSRPCFSPTKTLNADSWKNTQLTTAV